MRAPPGTYWVEPGRLLAGAHPCARTYADTQQKFKELLGAGVSAFVDLTAAGEFAPYEQLLPTDRAGNGRPLQYCQKSLPDHRIPPNPQIMRDILEHLEQMLSDGHCVYLHCRAGIGRTGMVAGCYLVHRGMEPERALERLQQLWEEAGRTAVWPQTPETDEQAHYVRRWGRAGPPTHRWWKLWQGRRV